jgi:tetratricopeptide (TPR) repeat protein
MKLNVLSKVLFCLSAILLASSCASNKPSGEAYQTPQNDYLLNDISQLDARQKADLYESIIAADLAFANGQYDIATSYYLSAARVANSLDLIESAIVSAQSAGDHVAIIQAAELWQAIDPKSVDALSLKISSVLALQNIESAIDLTQQMVLLVKTPEELALQLDHIATERSPAVANAYFSELSTQYPESISVLFARGSFYSRVAKLTKAPASIMRQAFSQLDQALAIRPDFIPAIELKTQLYYQTRQDDKAEAMLRGLHSDFPRSQPISQLLGQLLYDLKKYDLAKQHFSRWLKRNKNDDEARFYLAAAYFATAEYELSLEHYQQLLGSHYKPQMVYFFCGNAASQLKQYAQAIACYDLVKEGTNLTRAKVELAKLYALNGKISKALDTVRTAKFANDENEQIQLINIEVEILNQHVSKTEAQQRLASALETYPDNLVLLFKKIRIGELAGKPEQLLKLLNKASTKITDPAKVIQFNLAASSFLRNNNHYAQAVNWLDKALQTDPENKDYLYSRALFKEPLGLFDEMIEDFKYLLSLDPENLNIKNALGYTLADVNQELDYASLLIEQAFQAMPDNAAVIDSKGWLAYRKGSYEVALRFLKLSFKMSPSADVATHIGEVYWATGDKQNALEFWQKAKSLDQDNFLLANTIKRFGVEL